METNVSFTKDSSGVVLSGKNENKLEVQNLDGSLDYLTGNYEVYLKAPRNLELDLNKVKLTDGFSLVSAESIGEFDALRTEGIAYVRKLKDAGMDFLYTSIEDWLMPI